MKAIEQYFHVELFITLYKVVLTISSGYETVCVIIQMRTTEQYLYVVLYHVQHFMKVLLL